MAKPLVFAALVCVGVLGQDRGENLPLHLAAVVNKVEETKALIASGADVNALGEFGWTPLILAANNGHCPVMVRVACGRICARGCEAGILNTIDLSIYCRGFSSAAGRM